MTYVVTRRVGDAEVAILTDGATSFGAEMFPAADPEHVEDLLRKHDESEIRTNFNAVLIRTGGRTVLADAGPRDLFGPTCGHLLEALREAGSTPEEIDTLFATHLHPDHVAGMLTERGQVVFPNAELVVQKADIDFWQGDIPGADETLKSWQALAQRLLVLYGERLRIVEGEAEIAPGVTSMPLPGHTPGHAGYRIASGGEQLIHVGDIVHAPAIQVPDPEIAVVFDVDPDAARTARKRLLDELAEDEALFTGGHLLQPALQRVQRDGSGYRLLQG